MNSLPLPSITVSEVIKNCTRTIVAQQQGEREVDDVAILLEGNPYIFQGMKHKAFCLPEVISCRVQKNILENAHKHENHKQAKKQKQTPSMLIVNS